MDGTVIITDFQHEGRGQRGRSWLSAPGMNLTFSIIYDTSFLLVNHQYYLNMAVACGVSMAVASFLPSTDVRVRWPNDIFCNGMKLAGLLIENTLKGDRLRYSVVGIGLNVNQEEFPGLPNAISMKSVSCKEFKVPDVLSALCARVEREVLSLRSGNQAEVMERYNESLFGCGTRRVFLQDGRRFEAVIVGVDSKGRLIIAEGDAFRKLDHGQVQWS